VSARASRMTRSRISLACDSLRSDMFAQVGEREE
jgi:hypothetical protein